MKLENGEKWETQYFITFSLRVKFLKWLLVFQGTVPEMVSDPPQNRPAEAGRTGGPRPQAPSGHGVYARLSSVVRVSLLLHRDMVRPGRGPERAPSASGHFAGEDSGRSTAGECVCEDVARTCTQSLRVRPRRDQRGTARDAAGGTPRRPGGGNTPYS